MTVYPIKWHLGRHITPTRCLIRWLSALTADHFLTSHSHAEIDQLDLSVCRNFRKNTVENLENAQCTLQCANAAENKSTLHALPSCLNSKLLGPKSNFLLFKSPFHPFFHVLKRGEYLFSVCPKILSWQTWNLPSSWAEVPMAFNIQIEVGSSKPWNNYWHSTMGYSFS